MRAYWILFLLLFALLGMGTQPAPQFASVHRLELEAGREPKVEMPKRMKKANGEQGRSNPFAILSLVLGVAAGVAFFIILWRYVFVAFINSISIACTGSAAVSLTGFAVAFLLAGVAGLLGVVMGILGLSAVHRDPEQYGLKGLAIAGLIVAGVFAMLSLLSLLFAFL